MSFPSMRYSLHMLNPSEYPVLVVLSDFLFIYRGEREARIVSRISSKEEKNCSGFWKNRAAGMHTFHLMCVLENNGGSVLV